MAIPTTYHPSPPSPTLSILCTDYVDWVGLLDDDLDTTTLTVIQQKQRTSILLQRNATVKSKTMSRIIGESEKGNCVKVETVSVSIHSQGIEQQQQEVQRIISADSIATISVSQQTTTSAKKLSLLPKRQLEAAARYSNLDPTLMAAYSDYVEIDAFNDSTLDSQPFDEHFEEQISRYGDDDDDGDDNTSRINAMEMMVEVEEEQAQQQEQTKTAETTWDAVESSQIETQNTEGDSPSDLSGSPDPHYIPLYPDAAAVSAEADLRLTHQNRSNVDSSLADTESDSSEAYTTQDEDDSGEAFQNATTIVRAATIDQNQTGNKELAMFLKASGPAPSSPSWVNIDDANSKLLQSARARFFKRIKSFGKLRHQSGPAPVDVHHDGDEEEQQCGALSRVSTSTPSVINDTKSRKRSATKTNDTKHPRLIKNRPSLPNLFASSKGATSSLPPLPTKDISAFRNGHEGIPFPTSPALQRLSQDETTQADPFRSLHPLPSPKRMPPSPTTAANNDRLEADATSISGKTMKTLRARVKSTTNLIKKKKSTVFSNARTAAPLEEVPPPLPSIVIKRETLVVVDASMKQEQPQPQLSAPQQLTQEEEEVALPVKASQTQPVPHTEALRTFPDCKAWHEDEDEDEAKEDCKSLSVYSRKSATGSILSPATLTSPTATTSTVGESVIAFTKENEGNSKVTSTRTLKASMSLPNLRGSLASREDEGEDCSSASQCNKEEHEGHFRMIKEKMSTLESMVKGERVISQRLVKRCIYLLQALAPKEDLKGGIPSSLAELVLDLEAFVTGASNRPQEV
ncbi:hypothetical protein CBS101457_005598 [Exobasidium rhododendri]|nr:hypothetical protein CBS101457_005598 [Exobasidium rhododendri]